MFVASVDLPTLPLGLATAISAMSHTSIENGLQPLQHNRGALQI